jgi:hypothetical protein
VSKKRFNVAAWRAKLLSLGRFGLLYGLFRKLFCFHRNTVELFVLPYRYEGETAPLSHDLAAVLIVHECCACGHHKVERGLVFTDCRVQKHVEAFGVDNDD